ncbi:MAG: glycerate kinase [Desulforhopalus sp.]|jgi:hydroxypyruvate reductase|nr:glycerate kinase [Desulforhopalus sp.]
MPDRNARRQDAVAIFEEGLRAVNPQTAISNRCRLDQDTLVLDGQRYALADFERIIVLGAGKAGGAMGQAIEEILGDRISSGLICTKYGHLEKLQRIRLLEAGHPVPDEQGIAAARAIYDLARTADEKTLVVCLISGGGSALLPLPAAGISLADKQLTTRTLLACGATIQEINAIRKHLSKIKGGRLASAVYPGTLVSLILSDVVGDDLDSIASGLCVPDPTTYEDCLAILARYDITTAIPATVLVYLQAGAEGRHPETPKAEAIFFTNTTNIIIGSNFDALNHARKKAESLGYNTLLLSSMLEGESRDLAGNHLAIAREISKHGLPIARPACILSGGETTVRLRGNGKGGRNQEFVLAAALKMQGIDDVVVLSGGTDGNDGPTDAAGAFADQTTIARAERLGLDARSFLDNNDSYHFFQALGDLYITGPTNTNVMDLRILLL